ncbi:MAG: minichromosome maintenance protein MCM [Candidatus Aenigmatarchaeota archaeon]
MAEDSERLEEFFRTFYEGELLSAASAGKKSVVIDFNVLDKFDPDLADRLLNGPEQVLEAAKAAISSIDTPQGSLNLEVRFKNVPSCNQVRIRNLRSEHIGKFISIDGVVRRASEVLPEITVATFQCPSCTKMIDVIQKERLVHGPSSCDGCGYKGKMEMTGRKLFDSRWLTVEEPFDIATAEKQGNIRVYLKNDLTDPEMQRKCDPGSRLTINGTIKEIKRMVKGGMRTQMEIYMDANFVEPTEIEWEEVMISEDDIAKIKEMAADPNIYDKIVDSIAPSIYGLREVKEAIAHQLFGGVKRTAPDGSKLRGDIHILLVGDPAVGKTQLLKLVSKVIPRGKYVSGKGVTGVGLTASVTKDEEFMGGWVLEAGAMVLCHKGMIAIDEFDKMNKDDQIAMHEAMSTQTISIAKATIVATLPSQTAVLAGANPKLSRFDIFKPITDQIDVPETLLSRFDLKFALRDVPDKEQDERVADHIMKARIAPDTIQPVITPEILRKYIAYARHNCSPEFTPEAADMLKKFYIDMRSLYKEQTDSIAITARQQEALVRLAEASAKIRLSPKVGPEDAERAIKLMRYSMEQLAFDRKTGKFDIDRTEGTSSSKRNNIRIINDIIDKLERTLGKQIPIEEIMAEAQEAGVPALDAEEIISGLKREGRLFEPKYKHVSKAY